MKINFEKYFDDRGIDYIMEEVSEYLPQLFAQDLNFQLSLEKDEIEKAIIELNSSEVTDYFYQYEALDYIDKTQWCWLAYQLGFEHGIRKRKIKEELKKPSE